VTHLKESRTNVRDWQSLLESGSYMDKERKRGVLKGRREKSQPNTLDVIVPHLD